MREERDAQSNSNLCHLLPAPNSPALPALPACRVYHVREPETQRLEMSLPDFVQCAQQWTARRVHLRVGGWGCRWSMQWESANKTTTGAASHCRPNFWCLQETVLRYQPAAAGTAAAAERGGNGSGSGGGWAQPTPAEGSACGSALAPDLRDGVDWTWLAGLQRSQRYGPVLSVDVEAGGSTGGLLPARYECNDRLLAQVAGRRRVLLLSPEQAFEGLYPYPIHHTYDRYSMVDLEATDLGLWPQAAGLRGLTAVLEPGDVLFVPAYWSAAPPAPT